MKKIFYAITAILLFSSSAFAQKEITRIEGFRDLTWGSHLDSIVRDGEPLVFIPQEMQDENRKDGNYYKLKNENLLIGNVLLTDIYYVFSKDDNKLFKVLMVGRKSDVAQMEFIVDYKYGAKVNENVMDDQLIKQWIITDVTISLLDFAYNKFELELKSDWQAAAAYVKNTNVKDF